jgi:histidyl-tRNA synthetase
VGLRRGDGRDLFRRYNYSEIRTPVFEEARLFARTAGEGSDIVVQKEMFAFQDKGERELALRPEGTPGAGACLHRAQPVQARPAQ